MTASEADAAARNAAARAPKITRAESLLRRDREAFTEGAWALRYCAGRLSEMNGAGDPEVDRRVGLLIQCAHRLERMADRAR